MENIRKHVGETLKQLFSICMIIFYRYHMEYFPSENDLIKCSPNYLSLSYALDLSNLDEHDMLKELVHQLMWILCLIILSPPLILKLSQNNSC